MQRRDHPAIQIEIAYGARDPETGRLPDTVDRLSAALGETVKELAPFVRVFTNTLGNGRWFDSFVNDLIPTVVGTALCGGADTAVTGCEPTEGGR